MSSLDCPRTRSAAALRRWSPTSPFCRARLGTARIGGSIGILLPVSAGVDREDTEEINGMIGEVAGVRLSRAEQILPGLRQAVSKRVDSALKSEELKRR